MADTYIPLTIDAGTMVTKAGFGGEEAPRSLVPSLVGRPRHPGVTGSMLGHETDNFCGSDVVEHRGLLSVTEPMHRGRIVDWGRMEELLHHVLYTELQVATEEHPLLLLEVPDNTRQDREKTATMVFEGLNAPALVIQNTSVTSLYSTGRTTGLVLESGASRTHATPIWDGYTLQHYIKRVDYGGEDLTKRLTSMFRAEGYPFSTDLDIATVRDIKEQMCYVAGDAQFDLEFAQESRTLEKLYTLPDGAELYMNESRFVCPEILLSPAGKFRTHSVIRQPYRALIGKSDDISSVVTNADEARKSSSKGENAELNLAEGAVDKGWHDLIHEAIEMCEPSIRAELYASVVLGGGNTMFPKLDERIQRQVSLLAPKGVITKCVSFKNRMQAAWIGGSIIASLGTFPTMWVQKAEYDEHGPSIIHRKTL